MLSNRKLHKNQISFHHPIYPRISIARAFVRVSGSTLLSPRKLEDKRPGGGIRVATLHASSSPVVPSRLEIKSFVSSSTQCLDGKECSTYGTYLMPESSRLLMMYSGSWCQRKSDVSGTDSEISPRGIFERTDPVTFAAYVPPT